MHAHGPEVVTEAAVHEYARRRIERAAGTARLATRPAADTAIGAWAAAPEGLPGARRRMASHVATMRVAPRAAMPEA